MREPLPGLKTYVAAGMMVAYGLMGYLLGDMTDSQASMFVFNGITAIMLRLGIAKNGFNK